MYMYLLLYIIYYYTIIIMFIIVIIFVRCSLFLDHCIVMFGC